MTTIKPDTVFLQLCKSRANLLEKLSYCEVRKLQEISCFSKLFDSNSNEKKREERRGGKMKRHGLEDNLLEATAHEVALKWFETECPSSYVLFSRSQGVIKPWELFGILFGREYAYGLKYAKQHKCDIVFGDPSLKEAMDKFETTKEKLAMLLQDLVRNMPKTFDMNDKMDFDKNQAFDQQLLQKTILKESMMKRVSENQKLHNIGHESSLKMNDLFSHLVPFDNNHSHSYIDLKDIKDKEQPTEQHTQVVSDNDALVAIMDVQSNDNNDNNNNNHDDDVTAIAQDFKSLLSHSSSSSLLLPLLSSNVPLQAQHNEDNQWTDYDYQLNLLDDFWCNTACTNKHNNNNNNLKKVSFLNIL
ncbi:DNA polymerase epsilon, catalytic subunit a [Reticulomyxa filosa]|uniref:DNA polymerase epsilon, catalytic subunit a n=1 Tax=Reticulomyxa filosa TaxID=46433 RepID=X6MQ32_RETFI|nr:DNA polymerase epsilon, catalytic subunit a [Reticulomyxa filosa]|eukprot:ETO15542.1 DNA polymerase epsilon, catalytic subunit a [Reticulomyxa filosa]